MKSKLPEGVYKRKDSQFLWIRFTNRKGEEVRRSTKQFDPKKAKKMLAKAITEDVMAVHFPSHKFDSVIFKDLLDGWEEHLGDRITKNKLQYIISEIREKFGECKARSITSEDIMKYLQEKKELSASSLNHRRTVLNSVFGWAIKWKLYDDNPVSAIPQFKEPPGRQRLMSLEELSQLLDYSEKNDTELYVFLKIATISALRKGEILQRRFREVGLNENPHIRVPESKNGYSKMIPLTKDVVDAIKRLPSYRESEYLFPSKPTTRFPEPEQPFMWDIGPRFRKACKQIDPPIEELRVHDLRHFTASLLLMAGVSEEIVRKLTGHRSRELERYQHLSPEFRRKTVEVISKVMHEIRHVN